MKTKRILSLITCIMLSFVLCLPSSLAEDTGTSPPIAKGKMKTASKVYWGKNEIFPTIGTLYMNEEIDIYEYDKDWVLTLYDTYITYNNSTVSHSFYGYVKREDVLCEPPLKGEKSKKAETGPGKRKGKKPKKPSPGGSATPEPTGDATTKPDEPESSETATEDLMEYDWIIRTPGVCQLTVDLGEGMRYVCRFGLYAMKFGGYSASSLPVYNDGVSNPYVGYVSLSMKQKMQDMLDGSNLDFLKGFGGTSIDAVNHNARFKIDSQADNGTNTIISIMTNTTSVLDPKIIDDNMNIEAGGEMFRDERVAPLDLKLVGSGGEYKLLVLNMRPGGGDLSFPSMLEKFPLDDITKAERERKQKELQEEQRRKAKEEQEKALKEWEEKMKEGMEKELDEESKKGEETEIEIVPLEPINTPEIVPLEPINTPEIVSLTPLTTGGTPEEPDFFPGESSK